MFSKSQFMVQLAEMHSNNEAFGNKNPGGVPTLVPSRHDTGHPGAVSPRVLHTGTRY